MSRSRCRRGRPRLARHQASHRGTASIGARRLAVESLETSLAEPGFVNLRRDAMALKALILFEDLAKYDTRQSHRAASD